MTEHTIQRTKIPNNFKRPDNSRFLNIALEPHAGLTHPLSAEAVDLAAWEFFQETSRDFRAIHVAGGLAGDH
jgi:hypothetical protein